MTKSQRADAKQFLKEFVKAMVKGRQYSVVHVSGKILTCFVCLSRNLDRLHISLDKDKPSREIKLFDISEIIPGDGQGEVVGSTKGLLDVTLVLETRECITFRMPDAEALEKLVLSLTMLSNQAKDLMSK